MMDNIPRQNAQFIQGNNQEQAHQQYPVNQRQLYNQERGYGLGLRQEMNLPQQQPGGQFRQIENGQGWNGNRDVNGVQPQQGQRGMQFLDPAQQAVPQAPLLQGPAHNAVPLNLLPPHHGQGQNFGDMNRPQ